MSRTIDMERRVRATRGLLIFGPAIVIFGLWVVTHPHHSPGALTVSSGNKRTYLYVYKAWALLIVGALMFVIGLCRYWIDK